MNTLAKIFAEHRAREGERNGDSWAWCSKPCAWDGPRSMHAEHVDQAYWDSRRIRTVEELAPLPETSVVIDKHGDVSQKRGHLWCSYETARMTSHQLAKSLPAQLIWTPGDAS